MRVSALWAALLALDFLVRRATLPPGATVVALPDGLPGTGFDELRFSPTFAVLAPGGRSGKLDLVDPGGHGQGATTIDAGGGFFFVTDRGRF
jgi:hypothetical protein